MLELRTRRHNVNNNTKFATTIGLPQLQDVCWVLDKGHVFKTNEDTLPATPRSLTLLENGALSY